MLQFAKGFKALALAQSRMCRGAISNAVDARVCTISAAALDGSPLASRYLHRFAISHIPSVSELQQGTCVPTTGASQLWQSRTPFGRPLHASAASQIGRTPGTRATDSSRAVNPLQAILKTEPGDQKPAPKAAAAEKPAKGVTRVKTTSVHARKLRISPKKLNDFVRIIRKRSLREARLQCNYTPKKAAGITGKVLESLEKKAVAQGMHSSSLYIDKAEVGKGTHLKAVVFMARGRTSLMRKYRAHLLIQVREVLPREVALGALGTKRGKPVRLATPYMQRLKQRDENSAAQKDVPYFE
mmetsp:Transcript_20876/g.62819  ORF Transcript_20876/g.62819 Transcript_20876/m.62819 type:complete len:299 (-) Transcript_20876:1411-2307(-)